jgi:protein phosphatase
MTTDRLEDAAKLPAVPPGPASVTVDLGGGSHPGKVRPSNEDYYLVVRTARSLTTLLTNLPDGPVPQYAENLGYGLVVADGVGGAAAGDVAGRLALATLVRLFLDTPDWIMRAEEAERGLQRLAERYRQVDAALGQEARKDARLAGMGTTMTLAYSLGADLFLAHVGDSRAYLCRGPDLLQLTRDHTMAQAMADRGLIRPEEAATHQLRHVLTQALDGRGVEADVQRVRLEDGDQVLLCTDGLSNMVADADIAAILRQAATAGEACAALIQRALDNGGQDNVTVALARSRFPPQA